MPSHEEAKEAFQVLSEYFKDLKGGEETKEESPKRTISKLGAKKLVSGGIVKSEESAVPAAKGKARGKGKKDSDEASSSKVEKITCEQLFRYVYDTKEIPEEMTARKTCMFVSLLTGGKKAAKNVCGKKESSEGDIEIEYTDGTTKEFGFMFCEEHMAKVAEDTSVFVSNLAKAKPEGFELAPKKPVKLGSVKASDFQHSESGTTTSSKKRTVKVEPVRWTGTYEHEEGESEYLALIDKYSIEGDELNIESFKIYDETTEQDKGKLVDDEMGVQILRLVIKEASFDGKTFEKFTYKG